MSLDNSNYLKKLFIDEVANVLPEIVDDKVIVDAVNDYLTDNPVNAGATAEEAAQIKANKEAIEELQNDGGSSIELDTTLTEPGKAADAKAVGDKIVEKLNPAVTKSGNVVKIEAAPGLPLNIIGNIVAVQSGEGTPSPDNIRPFTPHASITTTVSNGTDEKVYTAQLGEDVYIGTYDFSTGLLTITGGVIDFVPEQRDNPYNDDGYCQYWLWKSPLAVKDGNAFQLSTFAPHVFANKTGKEHFWVLNDTFMFESNRWSTLEEAQAWFRANDAKILYMYNEPRTVQVDPQNILALAGINTVTSNAGDVTVTGCGTISVLEQTPKQKYGAGMLRYIHMPRVIFTGNTSIMTKENAVILEYEYRGAEDYANAGVEKRDVRDGGVVHKGWAKVKWQGSSSTIYAKKNYTITLYKDEACKDKMPIAYRERWGAQSKYCLKANFIDPSHCRNVVAAKIWGECVKNRVTTSESYNRMKDLPNYGAVDGFPVMVFFNGEYHGIYTFNIPKDEWMFGMKDKEGRNVVLCSEKNCASTNFSENAVIDGEDWSYEVYPADTSWVVDSFNRIAAAVAMPEETGVEKDAKRAALEACVDIWSVIEYDIFIHKVYASDNMKRNLLMVLYDNIWCMSAYDLDTSWWNFWTGTHYIGPGNHDLQSNALCEAVKRLYPEDYAGRKDWLTGDPVRPLHKMNIVNKMLNFMIDVPQEAYAVEAEIWPEMCGANVNAMQQIISTVMLCDENEY